MWYAGIDWADQHHDVVVLDEAGHTVTSRRVAHSAAGLEQLVACLQTLDGAGTVPPEQVACILETSSGLLIAALLDAGFAVFPVHAKTLHGLRKPSGAKTDQIDAYLLARKGRNDLTELRRLVPDSPVARELKLLTRDQDRLIQNQTQVVNQLTACLKSYWPGALTLFTKLHQEVTLAFLEAYPTLEQARRASVAEVQTLLVAAGHPSPAAKARQLYQQLHQAQLQADALAAQAKSRLMLALVAQLRVLLAHIAAYDAEITRLFATHPDAALFGALPGAGQRLAPRLLAEWGDDRERYAAASSVQALGGTAPVTIQSGRSARARTRSACSKPFRNVLHQFAWQSVQREGWAHAYYCRKRREGKSHPRAVRALANTWVRILYAIWRTQGHYEAAVFLAAQQAHGIAAA
jgi:transposase